MSYTDPTEEVRRLTGDNLRRQFDYDPLAGFLGPDDRERAEQTRQQREALQDALAQAAQRQQSEQAAAQQEKQSRDAAILAAYALSRYPGTPEQFEVERATLLSALREQIAVGRLSWTAVRGEVIGGSWHTNSDLTL